MKITFLGTACMQPTKERNHQGILLTYGSENILFDCGEGIQRQMKIEGIKASKITRLIISHWHGDHVLGIPGLIQTMGASEYSQKLFIYGPKGTKKFMQHMQEAFLSKGSIEYEVKEVQGKFIETKDFQIEAFALDHGVPCNGYRFLEKDKRKINTQYVRKLGIPDGPILGKLQSGQEVRWQNQKIDIEKATYLVKGKIISIVADTAACKNAVEAAKDADLLISEAVYLSKHQDKAEEYKHLTVEDATRIATQARVKRLILTHFSQRYKNISEIEDEARSLFKDVSCAYDFMKVKL